jgi:hypothetical protein
MSFFAKRDDFLISCMCLKSASLQAPFTTTKNLPSSTLVIIVSSLIPPFSFVMRERDAFPFSKA